MDSVVAVILESCHKGGSTDLHRMSWVPRGNEFAPVTLDWNFPEGLIEDPGGLIHIRLADIQHGREPDDVAVQTTFANEQAVLACAFEKLRSRFGGWFLRFAILHEFEPQHQTFAAHIADHRIFLLE